MCAGTQNEQKRETSKYAIIQNNINTDEKIQKLVKKSTLKMGLKFINLCGENCRAF